MQDDLDNTIVMKNRVSAKDQLNPDDPLGTSSV